MNPLDLHQDLERFKREAKADVPWWNLRRRFEIDREALQLKALYPWYNTRTGFLETEEDAAEVRRRMTCTRTPGHC
jgi:hypothetical protein